MINFYVQRIKTHKANLDRYSRLLATQLTQTERDFIHRRIAEKHSALVKLEAEHLARSVRGTADPDTLIAAQAVSQKTDPHIGARNEARSLAELFVR